MRGRVRPGTFDGDLEEDKESLEGEAVVAGLVAGSGGGDSELEELLSLSSSELESELLVLSCSVFARRASSLAFAFSSLFL